jgi:sensor c-di-GMP phosphodiesterase-like protein
MHNVKQRFEVVLAATLVAAIVGGAAGFLLARVVVLRVAEVRLADQAARSQTVADAYSADVRKALATMNASPYPYCSDSELTYFRHILFDSRYLREGGRMTGGRIDCSTTLGRNELPKEQFKPTFSESDGIDVYWNLAPFRTRGERTTVLQSGASYVDMSMQMRGENLPAGASLRVALRGLSAQQMNSPMDGNGKSFREDGFRRVGNMLSATNCSVRYPHCVTAAISETDAFRMGRPMFAVCIALLALAGGGLGFFQSLAYCRNRTMVQQLRRAIRKDELRMVYQPVVDLSNGRIVGAEALARWTDESGSEVAPDLFVSLADERGFVGEITRLALRHTLCDLGELLRSYPRFQVSVNVTAWDLADPKFVPMLEAALAQAGVRAKSVTIEITETSTARHEKAIETIRLLRASGHRVHIDDFGTGYSSLAYLHDLSVDAIKIDKVFTQAIGTGSVAVNILPQILAMADALNLEVVVEGIETEEQARYFMSTNKRIRAQGWLFGHPMPKEELLAMLEGEREKVSGSVDAAYSLA